MINFTRASTATYVDVGGVLTVAQVNEPRFEREGILIEGESTNLLPNSNPYKDSVLIQPAYYTYGMGDLKPALSADGKMDAVSFTKGHLGHQSIQFVTGNTYSWSFLFRPNDPSKRGNVRLRAGLVDLHFYTDTLEVLKWIVTGDTPNASYSLEKLSSGWISVKINSSFIAKTTGDERKVFWFWQDPNTIDLCDGITVCNFQIEKHALATSYIPTIGTPVTRAPDSLLVGNFLEFAEEQTFSIYLDIPTGNSGWVCPLESGNSSIQLSTSGSVNITGGSAYPTKGYLGSGMYTFTGNKNKQEITMYYKGTAVGIYKVSGVGSKVSLSTLYLGGRVNGKTAIYGHIRNFRQWKSALTSEQVLLIQGVL